MSTIEHDIEGDIQMNSINARRIRNWIGGAAAAVLIATVASPASAVIIFQDDFNRPDSNSVGNGWSEIEKNNNDVAIKNNRLRLRDTQQGIDAAASQLGGLDTTGLEDIVLMYDWRGNNNTEPGDRLRVQWRLAGVSGGWTDLVNHSLGAGGFASNSVGLPGGAENVSNLRLRFRIAVNASNEAAFIDNVKLTGDLRGPINVPEPGTLALLGVGLVGVGFLLRSRRITA